MAINLEKHREALVAAWKDVLDEKSDTNWALFGYDGLSNDLKFVSKGDGGLIELIDDFNSGKIQYAFLKVDLPDGTISKYVLINWQGEGAPTVRKGTCANHVQHVAQLFTGFHLTMHARTEDDLEEKMILDKLAKAGSAFNFKSSRHEEIPPSGPVGTAYRKVNPVQEINSKERDQFWLKEEQEEKKRVEAEKRRREEEKRKSEEEVRRRDELEAARRAKAEEQKRVQSDAEAEAGDAGAEVREAEAEAGVSAGEALRRQRSAEARRLIGASTAAARALFQQNLAQGQMSTRSNSIPEKPVRSSVIAQRINTFSQNAQSYTSIKSPTKTLEQPKPEENESKTSPLKNIDKIKMSLERPSQIQYEPIIDPSVDLSPSTEEPSSFSAINYSEYNEYNNEVLKQSEPMIKQNILENDMFDASYSSSNENDDDDSDNKFSTIKRSPYTKDTEARSELSRQNTVIENVHYKKENGTTTLDDVSPEGLEEEGNIYEDLDDDPGLTARALYDYQAADESEITFDPGDIITHIEQIDAGWWQGLGPRGVFGLFPANYVELLPCHPR
ncbi:PREDICTED: drebrin-like protein [Papilio polytes]|uniref:drebrin-like protein n=1 Tax=Papilio polytes TaxID=76194 RepID=UPI000675E3B4|nr:PREDICTED: drebrin-like protein [Papilio polytes]